jgi:hypothetical protein
MQAVYKLILANIRKINWENTKKSNEKISNIFKTTPTNIPDQSMDDGVDSFPTIHLPTSRHRDDAPNIVPMI